jgi:hypothetical protein
LQHPHTSQNFHYAKNYRLSNGILTQNRGQQALISEYFNADVIEATFENDLNFLLFSEDFSVALDFLTLQYKHNKGHFVGMFCKQIRKAHHMLTLLLTTYTYTLLISFFLWPRFI